ncbi:heme exporter protein CcmD [Inquilinus limosus]|uniref:Heme exporter protein D n=1 Tax=Inquilinus limosus TaxID=171674 RepID=A0A211ZNS6_9PROT|nr:heme exporter protein CcmD [Inquilinus limosus]OWJ66910.1 heme exporter protein CcmD [Inquilinus limosus]
MTSVTEFLAMGGYAPYVWTAYGAALVVLVGLTVATLARRRSSRRSLEALEQLRGRGRRA